MYGTAWRRATTRSPSLSSIYKLRENWPIACFHSSLSHFALTPREVHGYKYTLISVLGPRLGIKTIPTYCGSLGTKRLVEAHLISSSKPLHLTVILPEPGKCDQFGQKFMFNLNPFSVIRNKYILFLCYKFVRITHLMLKIWFDENKL